MISSHPLLTGLSDRNKHTQATAHLITSHCPIYFLVSVIYLMTRSPVFLPQLKVFSKLQFQPGNRNRQKACGSATAKKIQFILFFPRFVLNIR